MGTKEQLSRINQMDVARFDLCDISPNKFLVFQVTDSSNETQSNMAIMNRHTAPIAFKVKTTNPDKFRVQPTTGLINPDRTAVCSFFLCPYPSPPNAKDKFLIMVMVPGSGVTDAAQIDANAWAQRSPQSRYLDHKIQCQQVMVESKPEKVLTINNFDRPDQPNSPSQSRRNLSSKQARFAGSSVCSRCGKLAVTNGTSKKGKPPDQFSQSALEVNRTPESELENKMTRMFQMVVVFGVVALISVAVFLCIYIYQVHHTGQLLHTCEAKLAELAVRGGAMIEQQQIQGDTHAEDTSPPSGPLKVPNLEDDFGSIGDTHVVEEPPHSSLDHIPPDLPPLEHLDHDVPPEFPAMDHLQQNSLDSVPPDFPPLDQLQPNSLDHIPSDLPPPEHLHIKYFEDNTNSDFT